MKTVNNQANTMQLWQYKDCGLRDRRGPRVRDFDSQSSDIALRFYLSQDFVAKPYFKVACVILLTSLWSCEIRCENRYCTAVRNRCAVPHEKATALYPVDIVC
jgi:hypothetical protein